MPRPEIIRRASISRPSFPIRLRSYISRAWYEHGLARRKAGARRRCRPAEHKTVAFILGCQRSGTTMVHRTLDRLVEVDKFEEHDARAFVDCRIVGKDVRDALVASSTANCVIFKPICDSHRAAELLADHPGSKAVWIYRNYEDVANSSMGYWGDQTLAFIRDLLDGGGDWGVAQWNRERIEPETISEIRGASAGGLCPYGACALFWYMRNSLYFSQGLDGREDTLLVRYEDTAQRPGEEFDRICRFLKLSYDPAIIADVFATSVRRRKFPPVNDAVRGLCEALLSRLDLARRTADALPS